MRLTGGPNLGGWVLIVLVTWWVVGQLSPIAREHATWLFR